MDKATTRDPHAADTFGVVPANVLGAWVPALSYGAEWNAKLQEGLSALGCEWQEFVSRRMQDDFGLVQAVSSAQSPEQAWTAYVKFWQKAAEDYAREFAAVSKLTGRLLTGGIDAVQRRKSEASETAAKSKAA